MKIDMIVRSLGRLSRLWLKKNYPYRGQALRRLVTRSGFAPETAEALLDGLFKELTSQKLRDLLKKELGDPRVLDGWRPAGGRRLRARGPARILHIFAGNVPNPAVLSFIFGMLVKSRNIGKPSVKDTGFLDIYLRSLRSVDKRLARSNRLLPAGRRRRARVWMKKADLVVAYGRDETLRKLKKEAGGVPFIAYGHRASFALFTREALGRGNIRSLARRAARDIWMMDRRGCLSPLTLYAERGGRISPSDLSLALSRELARFSASQINPRGSFRQAAGGMVRENLRRVKQISYVRPFSRLDEVYRILRPFGKNLQAVALEAGPKRREKIAEELSRLGANRVCRAGRMQEPPLAWHHDGRPNLSDWVRWTDLEN